MNNLLFLVVLAGGLSWINHAVWASEMTARPLRMKWLGNAG